MKSLQCKPDKCLMHTTQTQCRNIFIWDASYGNYFISKGVQQTFNIYMLAQSRQLCNLGKQAYSSKSSSSKKLGSDKKCLHSQWQGESPNCSISLATVKVSRLGEHTSTSRVVYHHFELGFTFVAGMAEGLLKILEQFENILCAVLVGKNKYKE